MVGGYLIEKMRIGEGPLTRLWVYDPQTYDEVCLCVKTEAAMPELQEEIWWQGGKVFFDNDNKFLKKVGNSQLCSVKYLKLWQAT